MTREEAIKRLSDIRADYSCFDDDERLKYHALSMAIEALQDDWIPVSEPPKENGDYIVSLEDCVYPWGRFFNGKWFMLSTDSIAREFGKYEVIAWQPLPKPYNGDTRGEE